MKNWSRKKRWTVGIAACAALLSLFVGSVLLGFINVFHAHEHCIKNTGLTLRTYAGEHFGKYPYHTNGFGDAIVEFVKEYSPDFVGIFTAPGDDGELLKKCVKSGTHMPDERCSRMYVQGLSEASNPEIAIVFDRYPTRGGDHSRRPWGPLLRDVCMADGITRVIAEENWPEFRRQQIGLLVTEGFTRAQAEKIYEPMLKIK